MACVDRGDMQQGLGVWEEVKCPRDLARPRLTRGIDVVGYTHLVCWSWLTVHKCMYMRRWDLADWPVMASNLANVLLS